nr:transposase [Ktedonobacter sp. SOSP1-85]
MCISRVNMDLLFGIHRLVKRITDRSSRCLRQEFPQLKRALPTLWTNSSCVSTSGGASLSVIKQSIEQQNHVSQDISLPDLSDKKARDDPHPLATTAV